MSQHETIVGLGARGDHVAIVPNLDPARLSLTPEESLVLELVGRASVIQDVLARSGLSEPRAIAVLLSLRAKGAIVPAKVVKPAPPSGQVNAASNEEVDLDPARKKEILDLERVMDGLNHFEVFGLRPGAAPADVKKAFYEASRRYHPDRYFGKNLGSFRARIERIFRRLSEAHQVLTDLPRREAYLAAHPELSPAPPPEAQREPEDPVRAAERRARMAKHPYLAKSARLNELVTRAKAQMAKGDFGAAYTDLHMAAQLNEKNSEVTELLAEARRRHDVARGADEMKKAAEAEAAGDQSRALSAYKSAANIDAHNAEAAIRAARAMSRAGDDPKESKVFAQRAVDLEPKNAGYRVLLGQLLLEAGMKALAKRQFEEALRLEPNHPEAKKHVKKWWPF
ncbi:MAG: J domain-containing protein [Myxococcaceae bacterium]